MPLLTLAQVREHVETDITDEALMRILTAEEDDIISRFGAHATASQELNGYNRDIVLTRPAASITSITEYNELDEPMIIDSTDWSLLFGGRVLRRLYNGLNPLTYWPIRVMVEYVPEDQTNLRIRVLIDLVKLAVQYNGVAEETVGDFRSKGVDYTKERERLMRQLAPRKGMVFA